MRRADSRRTIWNKYLGHLQVGALYGTRVNLDLLKWNRWLSKRPINFGVLGEQKLHMLLCLQRFINMHFLQLISDFSLQLLNIDLIWVEYIWR